jgi:hypothetical protein
VLGDLEIVAPLVVVCGFECLQAVEETFSRMNASLGVNPISEGYVVCTGRIDTSLVVECLLSLLCQLTRECVGLVEESPYRYLHPCIQLTIGILVLE